MRVRLHEKLIVWQKSYTLSLWAYKITATFPQHELFAMTNQIRRAAYSVPLNIAEGNARTSKKEKRRFLNIAQASLEEVHVLMRLAHDLQYIDDNTFKEADDLINRTGYLLRQFIQSQT